VFSPQNVGNARVDGLGYCDAEDEGDAGPEGLEVCAVKLTRDDLSSVVGKFVRSRCWLGIFLEGGLLYR
jgi:hypothetical protein